MNADSLFNFGRKTPEKESTIQTPVLSLNNARKFLADARGCLNVRDGCEFVNGIRAAFMPLSDCVSNKTGKVLEYGDTLRAYARLTRDKPEARLAPLVELASKMRYASACGVRFIVAELILAYGFAGVNPGGPLMELTRLANEAVDILEIGSKFG
jgi:hypothetical protein